MRVNEIFYSIQGEGRNMNVPTAFIRLQGCNLNPGCLWCDTPYAQTDGGHDFNMIDVMMTLDNIWLGKNARSRYNHVCLTGGEPLVQDEEVFKLVQILTRQNYPVEIFTNGSIVPPYWHNRVSWVVDVKCPSSGVSSRAYEDWCATGPFNQVKFVVADDTDLKYVTDLHPDRYCRPEVIISPMLPVKAFGPAELEWARTVVEFCKKYQYRFSLQQHKLLWGNRKGV